jgi:hypothetical protein
LSNVTLLASTLPSLRKVPSTEMRVSPFTSLHGPPANSVAEEVRTVWLTSVNVNAGHTPWTPLTLPLRSICTAGGGGGTGFGGGVGPGAGGGVGVGVGVGVGAGGVGDGVGTGARPGGALNWVSVTRVPATVTFVVRAAPPFGAAVTRTEPVPEPDAGLTVTHDASAAAVHAHALLVWTATIASPPAPATGFADAVTV